MDSPSNMDLVVYLGHAWGQVFRADDTLIKSITVWRSADPDTNYDPMHLFITGLDSQGRPDRSAVLLDGPALVIPLAPAPDQPTEVRYEFDPPFELPSAGKYWFGIKEESCGYVFGLLGDSTNVYPDGEAWRFEKADFECAGIGCCPESFGGRWDLIFEIEFCDSSVQAESATWGRVKAYYR